MSFEENNFETVIIEGQVWAVTPGNETGSAAGGDPVDDNISSPAIVAEGVPEESAPDLAPAIEPPDSAQDSTAGPENAISVSASPESEFDPLRALTSLLLGGAIEGTSQLVNRLQTYEEEIKKSMADSVADSTAEAPTEDELDRLRYAFVGLVLDAQATFRRNLSLWARVIDRSTRATNRVARPVAGTLMIGPLQRRYDRLVQRGEKSLARWLADGRKAEPFSRDLAKMTYTQIVDEFINRLAENPELESLITQQSIGLAGEARDEVRERTVTADNLMEGIVRRILRRTPRAELPGPPPEVQRWANLTLEEYKGVSKTDKTQS